MMTEDYEEVTEFEASMARALADADMEVQQQAAERQQIQQEEQAIVGDMRSAADEAETYWSRFGNQLD